MPGCSLQGVARGLVAPLQTQTSLIRPMVVSEASQGHPNPRHLPSPALTHVVHNGGLGCLSVEINDSVDTRGHIPGSRALSHPIDKEVESPILPAHYTHRVPCLGRRGSGVRSQAELLPALVLQQPCLPTSLLLRPELQLLSHLEAVQVVPIFIQDGCPIVHHSISSHHPGP